MKSVFCAVALLFSSVVRLVPVAHAMGRYEEPAMCKVDIFEILASFNAQIDEEQPDKRFYQPYEAESDYAPGEEEIAFLSFVLWPLEGCVANLAQLELFTTSTTGIFCAADGDDPTPGCYVTGHKMTSQWAFGSASTWNTMMPLQYDPAASFNITRSFLSADVTDDVNGWLAGSFAYGWAFKNNGDDAYKYLTYRGAAEKAGEQYCEDSDFTEEQCLANDASSPCECEWADGEEEYGCIWAGKYGGGGKCTATDGVVGRGPKLLLVAHDCPSTAARPDVGVTLLATRTFSSPGCATETFEITSSVATELDGESGEQDSPYGYLDEIDVDADDPEQGLLKFDLEAIQGCDVIHAQLELHTISDTVGDAVKAYRLNGAAAWDASTTTWNSMSGPGGARPSQYGADPSFTTDPYSGAFLSADVTEDVAAWLANPADNQGWAFISDDSDGWGFKTSMDDKPAEHPKLVVVAANCP